MRLTFLTILKYSNKNDLREKMHQILPQMLSGNHLTYVAILNDLHDLENKVRVKVMRFKLGFCLEMGALCTKFGEFVKRFFRYRAENILNDFE